MLMAFVLAGIALYAIHRKKQLPSQPAPGPTPTLTAASTFASVPDPAPSAALLYQGMPNAAAPGVRLQVQEWQSILKKFGYDLGSAGPARDGIDGAFGSATTAATRAFQEYGRTIADPSIVVDGKVGPVTRRLAVYRALRTSKQVSGYGSYRRVG